MTIKLNVGMNTEIYCPPKDHQNPVIHAMKMLLTL